MRWLRRLLNRRLSQETGWYMERLAEEQRYRDYPWLTDGYERRR